VLLPISSSECCDKRITCLNGRYGGSTSAVIKGNPVGAWRTAAVLGCMGVFLLWASFIGTCADVVFAHLPCHCHPIPRLSLPPAVYRHDAVARTTWQPWRRGVGHGG
jgi:hypothetical protein